MPGNSLADHPLSFSLKRAEFEDMQVSVERCGYDALIVDSHIGELEEVEVVIGRWALLFRG